LLRNLSRRVEDHVIAVVKDIEASDPEKSFSYHEVAEGEMRRNIRQRLHAEMEYRYSIQYLASPLEILTQILEPVARALPPPPLPPHTQEQMTPAGPPSKQEMQRQREAKKTKGTLHSPAAVAKLETYVKKRGMSYTEFATEAGTSDKTLRGFRKTSRVRRYVFDGIAKAMGLTREQLLND
jgi:lambda repressor-like predicted transcriptional regulator